MPEIMIVTRAIEYAVILTGLVVIVSAGLVTY